MMAFKDRTLIITAILTLWLTTSLQAQDTYVRPQLWNNLSVAWGALDHLTLTGETAYNVLLSDELEWQEITVSVNGIYRFHRFMAASAGIYLAWTRQEVNLNSFECRPNLGFLVNTNAEMRWLLTNLSKFEWRIFRYSDNTSNKTVRFRNRTYGVVSLIRPSLLDDHNLMLFSYFELFLNFGMEVRERFFDQFKYKLGFAYRFNRSWNANLGMVLQDARNNLGEPAQLPVIVNTRWILEWGVNFVIPKAEKDQK